tara:strand:+ start:175 stop:699 length:525 start_codon:yes stop_codon:yes gene_type:complete
MPRSVDLINLARIDLLKGKSDADLDSLSKILRDNYKNRLLDDVTTSSYEDSYCPSNDIVDGIIREMKNDFYAATEEEIEVENFWGHIHEKNMSTNCHNHTTSYVSAVLYVEVPEGSGKLVFRPRINQYDNSAYISKFNPERGVFYMFPSHVDHYVSRNLSDDMRISISFNFRKL